jgi:hypothetical protein
LTGEGTEDSPYLINTPDELNLIGLFPCDWDKRFKLMADIDMSGFDGKDGNPPFNIIAPGRVGEWEALVFRGTPFTGLFDGNGHTISHLTVKTNQCGGLFGGLGSEGQVSNLGVVDVNVVGSGGVGGLVGGNEWGSFVTQCYSTGPASGESSVGGLAGYTVGNVTHCYSTGRVSGVREVGGLIGTNYGTDYSPVTGCFWDVVTSGQLTSAAGTGKTTAEMQTASTFVDAGWDFAGETTNGTDDIWWILEGKDYPRLWWEAHSN